MTTTWNGQTSDRPDDDLQEAVTMTAQTTFRVTRCKTQTCKAPIIFVRTIGTDSKGRPKEGRMPLLADPATNRPAEFKDNGKAGRVQQEHVLTSLFDDDDDEVVVRVLGKDATADPELPIWLTHFVDCPAAEKWRMGNDL